MERGQRFKRRVLRRGYKVDEVDTFLDRVEATLTGEEFNNPIGPDEVRDIIFKTRWGGYDEWHVDMELDRLERQLEQFMDDPGTVRGSSGFPALSQRKSLALPAGSSPAAAEHIPEEVALSPGVYRSSASDDELSFTDLGAAPRVSPGSAKDTYTDNAVATGGAAATPPRSRPAPSLDSPATAPRPRSRNVTPHPLPPAGGAPDAPGAATASPGTASPGTGTPSSVAAHNGSVRSTPRPNVDPYAPRHGKTEMTVEVPTYGGDVSPFTQADKKRLTELQQAFKLRRFGSGYESSQVERLWEAMLAAMDGRASARVTDADFDPAQFALVQGGYFEQEVDAALKEVRDLFHQRMG